MGGGAPGSLDPEFGDGGTVIVSWESGAVGRAVTLDHEGRVLVTGQASDFATVDLATTRHLSSGALDPSFGTGGKVSTDLGLEEIARSILVQPDGKILIGGMTRPVQDPYVAVEGDFALVRYLANGQLDPEFGNNGVVTTDLGSGDVVWDLALLPDERIVAAGSVGPEFGIAIYNPDGTLDKSFGGIGWIVTDVEHEGGEEDLSEFEHGIRGVGVQADGKIVVAGMANVDIVVHRYTQDGTLDPTFAGDGRLELNVLRWDYCRDLAIDPQGRILLASHTEDRSLQPPVADWAAVRILPDGTLDPSFGEGGIAHHDFGGAERARGVAIQGDGKILIAGGQNPTPFEPPNFAAVRLLEDGDLDLAFGAGGQAVTEVGEADAARGVVVQEDGGIVLAGVSDGSFALVRYLGH